jgi:3-oxoadipate enol-lactonase
MYCEIEGAGAPVLLIGGLGADLNLHKAIITGLATRGHRVVAFDNRGAGRSDTPDVPYTIGMFAHDTLGLMDVLHLDRVDFIGISMGGRIAIELAARYPDRVDRLVLVATSATGTGRVSMSLPMRLMTPFQWIPGLRGKYPQPRFAHLCQRQAATSYDGAAQLGQIHAPTLVMHGRGKG